MYSNLLQVRRFVGFWLCLLTALPAFAASKLKAEDMKCFESAQKYATRAGLKLDKSKVRVSRSDSSLSGPEECFITDELTVSVSEETGRLNALHYDKKIEGHIRLVEQGRGKKPALTEAEALSIAKKFITDIAGENISEYEPKPFFDGQGSSRGKWRVPFYRTYKGFTYQDDWFNVSVSDLLGEVTGFARSMRAETCPTEVKISEKEAIEKAKSALTKFLTRAGKEDSFYTVYRIYKIESTKLSIINPNYDYTLKWKGYRKTKKARLAYVVKIRLVNKGNPKDNTRTAWVWIDAQNGEVLGGDRTL